MAKKKKEELNEEVNKNQNILLESRVEANQIKEELEKYIDEKVESVFLDELEKANKRVIREKSKKILVKNITIIILLAIIGFLIYLLYTNNYFEKLFNYNSHQVIVDDNKTEDTNSNKVEDDKPQEEKEDIKPTLEELKSKYADLLDNYHISSQSLYLNDYYKGNLSSELKKYLTLATFDFNTIPREDDAGIILEDTFKIAYERIFSDDYQSGSFDYNGNKVRYIKALQSYFISPMQEGKLNTIQREIIDIEVFDEKVMITTIEGIVDSNKLYNVLNEKEIIDYQGDSLINYKDALNKMTYTFKNGKLVSLN